MLFREGHVSGLLLDGMSPQADTSFLFVILAFPSPIYNEKYAMVKCLLLILQIWRGLRKQINLTSGSYMADDEPIYFFTCSRIPLCGL